MQLDLFIHSASNSGKSILCLHKEAQLNALETSFVFCSHQRYAISKSTQCVMGLKAAGIAGPYYGPNKRYSRLCLLTFGIFFKGGIYAGADYVYKNGPDYLVKQGFTKSAAALGRLAAVLDTPIGIGISAAWAIDSALKKCECQ